MRRKLKNYVVVIFTVVLTNVRVRVAFVKNVYKETCPCRKMMKAMTSFVLNLDFDKKRKLF